MDTGYQEALERIQEVNAKNYTELNLSFLDLKELPTEIAQLTQLTELYLSSNQLTQLPTEIAQLTQLTELYLDNNQLTRFPKEIAQLNQLTTLYLSSNQLTQLPKEIAQLTQLTSLDLNANQLTQLPKEIAQLTQLTSLYLSSNQLTQLPKEIAQLTQLTSLYLSSNQLTQFPKEIAQLTQLTTLYLSSNQLTQLPTEIAQLTQLTSLDLSSNQLTQFPKEIAQLNQLTSLYLSSNQLTQFPKEIAQLNQLTSLDLSSNQLTQFPKEIAQLSQLTSLNLNANQLTQFPKEIAQLSQLTSLNLSSNQLTQLPTEIAQLTQLTELDLSSNQLTQFPKEIAQLTQLTSLYLSSSQLTQLPKEIAQLTQLTTLDLSSSQLTQLPKEIAQLTQLTSLDLSSSQLTQLPKAIAQLTQLTSLNLDNNQLTQLPTEIAQLTQLTSLNLDNNQLTQLPTEIAQLTQLTSLNLNANQLTQLPKEIAQLTQLTSLYLDSNQLTQLPKEIAQLTQLDWLILQNNQLIELPKEIAQLTQLVLLILQNNQFGVGPETFDLEPAEQIQEILKWQAAQAAGSLQPIHEAKVIFIGESNYGKTHLIEFLQKGEIVRKITTTHGIERSQLEIPYEEKSIRLNIWDLGGQEFMRSTHQFFFSERTLYVLVTLARKERNELNHWLKLASQLGNKAPILVVINKIDLDPHDLDRKSLQRDYPNIIGFVRTCIKDKDENKAEETINNLKKAINDIVCNQELMPSIFEKRRPEWFTVKEQLERLEEEGVDFISYREYEKLDHVKSLPGDERKSNLKLLSMLGAVVSFVDDPRLMDTNVINPQWIMDGVYSIINDPTIKDDNKGRFELQDLSRVLNKDRFPENRHIFLLDLLEKFNLCYGISGKKEVYYIPDLFEDIEPDFDWDSDDALRFRYNYDDFPPDAFMTRFIVEMHEDIKDDTRWRSGVLISNGACQAKVYQAFRKNHIEIEVLGNKAECPRYLYAIRDTFRRLHKPFPEMIIKQQIMYKGYWLNYPQLVKLEDRNKPFYHIDLDEDLPIAEILNGYSTLRERQSDILGRIEKKIDKIDSQTLSTHSLLSFGLTQNSVIKYPNIFTLKPARQLANSQSNASTPYDFQLYCSHTDCLHPVGDPYKINIPKDWVLELAPYYNGLIKTVQQLAPLIRPSAYLALGANAYKPQNLNLIATKDYIGKLQGIGSSPNLRAYEPKAATEADLQIIKQILDQADPGKQWMKHLQKVIPVDKVIWVCPQHAEEY